MQAKESVEGRFALTAEERESFSRNGFIGPFTLYPREEMKTQWKRARLRLLDRSAAVYQDIGAISGVTNIANYDRHLDDDFLAEHVCRPEITERVASILGPDVLCWRTEFFPKYPGDEGTDWHQADTFANASGTPQILWPENKEFGGTITVWTAFSDATIASGCLQFIPGTQNTMNYDETKRMSYDPDRNSNTMKQGTRRGFFGYDYRQLQIDEHWSPDESQAVSMQMQAGQFIIFWSTLMHASHPHFGESQEMRMGFASRYVPATVEVYPGSDFIEEYGGKISLERYGSVVVSGQARANGNRISSETTRGKKFRNF